MLLRQKIAISTVLALTSTLCFATVQTTLKGCHKTGKTGSNISCVYNVKNGSTLSKLYAQTAMPYALCSKAFCKPGPKNSHTVICSCPVYGAGWQGASVGPKSYKASKPTYSKHKLATVTSNFSMANLSSTKQKPTTCSADKKMPWANCFGIRCKVTYVKTKHGLQPQASCQCPIAKSKSFISVGPNNTKQCYKGLKKGMIWSAALSTQGQSNGIIIPAMYTKYFGK